MVCSTVTDSEKEAPAKGGPCCAVGIAPGDYRLVGWDMDTTGKKVIDEVCQIATYTPSSAYSQYVMPYKDLNPTAIKRHSMKVVTNGKFRVLRHSKTNEVIKSKSEVSALTDFLSWLENVKGDTADGIILVYHEPRKVIPAMLLESLKKYDLVGRFKQTVKGFANGFNIAEQKCANSAHVYSLRTLSRTLLKKEGNLGNAQDRASLALQVVQYLCSLESGANTEDKNGKGDTEETEKKDETAKKMVEFVREFAQPVDVEEQEHDELKMIFERQNNLRPIFSALFRMNRKERQHASPLRRLLAEAGIEYSELQNAWTNEKKEGLEHLLKEKLPKVEEKKIDDLLFILERHFDPEKKPKAKEIPERKKEVKSRSEKVNDDKENNNNKCDSGTESPDTTTSGSPVKLTGEDETKTL